jgi:hypothetical protein
MNTDNLVSMYQEKQGYESMHPAYMKALKEDGIILLCKNHALRLTYELNKLGRALKVESGEFLYRVIELNQNDKL